MVKGGSQYRTYGKTHYERNKQDYINRAKERRAQIKSWFREQKDRPCQDCEVSYPHYVMDFDHRDPEKKVIGPAKMIRDGWSIERMEAEIAKCDVVCSNCHRERTHGV